MISSFRLVMEAWRFCWEIAVMSEQSTALLFSQSSFVRKQGNFLHAKLSENEEIAMVHFTLHSFLGVSKTRVGVGASFLFFCLFFFILTQILISRKFASAVYRYNIFRYKENKKEMWWSSFFRVIPNSRVTFQSRQSYIEAANFFSSSTPIQVLQ